MVTWSNCKSQRKVRFYIPFRSVFTAKQEVAGWRQIAVFRISWSVTVQNRDRPELKTYVSISNDSYLNQRHQPVLT